MFDIDNQVAQLGAILVQGKLSDVEAARLRAFLGSLILDGPVATIPGHFVKCDAEGCGYSVDLAGICDFVDHINAPCPKCGANSLTPTDVAALLVHLADYHKINVVARALGKEDFNKLVGVAAQLTGVDLESVDPSDTEFVRKTIRSDGQGGVKETIVTENPDA